MLLYPPPCCVHTEIDMASFASRVLSYIVPAADQLYSQGKNSRLQSSSQTDERGVPTTAVSNDKVGFGVPRPPRPNQSRDHTTAPGYTRMSHSHTSLRDQLFSRRRVGAFLFKIQHGSSHTTPCPGDLEKGPAWNLIRGGGFCSSVEEI